MVAKLPTSALFAMCICALLGTQTLPLTSQKFGTRTARFRRASWRDSVPVLRARTASHPAVRFQYKYEMCMDKEDARIENNKHAFDAFLIFLASSLFNVI